MVSQLAFSYPVEALKRQIPSPDREWHVEGHYWRVKASHEHWLVRFACTFPMAEYQQGAVTTDLHTGRTREQLDLCGGANDA
jgi:hypothetical protein